MKRITALTLLILILLCSCSKSGTGKSFAYPIDASPSTLDPQYANETGAKIIINNCFEGLVRLNDDGEIIPGIAKEWKISDDGLTYTFSLKEGTEWYCPIGLKNQFGDDFYKKFSNEKVKAKDFVFACRRAVSGEIASPLAQRLFIIKNAKEVNQGELNEKSLGVTATDENTLRFDLSEPCDDFLTRLTESEFMPCNEDFYTAMGGRYGLTHRHILCNGPFYVSSWDPEASLTIKANKYYAGEQSTLPASVVFSFVSDRELIAKKVEAGSLCAALLSPEFQPPKKSTTVKDIPGTVFGFVFNCADPALSSAMLRQALSFGIDREIFGADTFGFVPQSCIVGSENYSKYAVNMLTKIKQSDSLAVSSLDTGLAQFEMSVLDLTILCPEEYDTALHEQVQHWQKLFGMKIAIKIETLSSKEISDRIKSKNYQLALAPIKSNFENAADFLNEFNNGGPFNFDPAVYDSLTLAISEAGSTDEIIAKCARAENYILKESVFYPITTLSSRFVLAKDMQGISMPGGEDTVCFINAKRFD